MAWRKKKKNPGNWKSNQRKFGRLHGKSYTSVRNQEVQEKVFENKDCECPKECVKNVSVEGRQQVFDHFYSLQSKSSQILYVKTMIVASEPKKKYTSDDSKAHDVRFSYILRFYDNKNPRNIPVCRQFLADTFQISLRTLTGWAKKPVNQLENKKIGVPSPKKIDSANVLAFLEKIPCYDSHYSRRKNSTKKYLDPGLTLTKLYQMYTRQCQEENRGIDVKSKKFEEIIKNETNIYIHNLHKDTCATCDSIKTELFHASMSRRKNLLEIREKHQIEVEKTKKMFDDDRDNADENSVMVTFDLQKALPLPVLTSGPAYYSRNIYVYNLGVHCFPPNFATSMFVWDETTGSRGSQEISSCLVKFLRIQTSQVKKIMLYCDRCGAQNRNIKLTLSLLQHLSSPQVETETIDIKFMVSGHSYLPNDRDFGVIEKEIQRHENIYEPNEYYEIIRTCKEKLPFKVIEMNREEFLSTSTLEKSIVNRKKTEDNEKADWTKMSWIRLEKNKPFQYKFKNSITDENFQTVNLKNNKNPNDTLFPTIKPLLYQQPRLVSTEKIQNIQNLMRFIPQEKQNFYQNLPKE